MRICTCGSELFVATNHSHDTQVCGNAEGARRFKGKMEGLLHQDFYHYSLRADSFHPSNETLELLQGHLLIMVQVLSDFSLNKFYSWDLGQDDPRKHHMKVQARCHYHSLLSAPANVSTHPQLLDTDIVDDATMCKIAAFHTALRVRCQTGGTNAMMCDCGVSWMVAMTIWNASTFW